MPPEDSSSNYEYTVSEDAGTDGADAGRAPDSASGSAGSGAGSGAAGGEPGSIPRKPLGLQRSDRRPSDPASNRPSDRPASGSPPTGRPPVVGRASGFSSLGGASSSALGGQAGMDRLASLALQDLESKRRDLQREVDQLERRKERLAAEMRSSFAGASQDVAIRVQGFKEYLIGSLQDLVTAAEDMDLAPQRPPEPVPTATPVAPMPEDSSADSYMVPLAAQRFAEQRDRINSLLDQYRTRPDYYGPPWQLRRTFEPIHADRASNWFFNQGGRGAVKSMGSRLQNVLVASAAISCIHSIYDRRLCVLVLATTPERLGEWRRWLQDCLGISRADFGANRGVMLFEASEPMSQRAERLLDSGRIPFLIMDEAEDKVSLSLLQYPLWMGFAPDPANPSTDYDYY
ncbi:MAG: DUF3086 domain-containing protein [Cyanobacteria bacterium J06598_3]